MMKKLLSLLVVMFMLFTLAPSVSAQTDNVLTVATYNVENAFDVYDDPYTKDEGTDVKLRWEYERIAEALKAINADVVGFQEVENEHVLQALVDEYLPGMGYKHVAVPLTNDTRGIKLGLISRLPIESITSYRWQTLLHPEADRSWRFARDLFHAKLRLPNGELLNVFVVHLKSKGSREGDPQSVKWRSSEAMRIRQIISDMLAENPDEKIILMGDFNSQPGEPALNALLTPAASHGNGPVPGSGPGTDNAWPILYDCHQLIPMEDRTTYPSERFPNSVIDFIFTSPAMTSALLAETAKVFKDPELTRGSDHLPVVASFEMAE